MNYIKLNEKNRKQFNGITKSKQIIEWEDPDLLDILLGKLPKVKLYSQKNEFSSEIKELKKLYQNYNFIVDGNKGFLETIKSIGKKIKEKNPNWYGINIYELEESLKLQKFALISGEGGIGKSFFINQLENKLTEKNIKHLCLYGKFEKNLSQIDFEEIKEIASKEEFIFIFDALNEIETHFQIELYDKLNSIKNINGLRIIITYKNYALKNEVLNLFKSIAEITYSFKGVSFESTLESLNKLAIPDIYKYENILYSNNAMLMKFLQTILNDEKIVGSKIKSIASITFILEQYIKSATNKSYWTDTKKIVELMYSNNTNNINRNEIEKQIDLCNKDYFEKMINRGFITMYELNDKFHYTFSIETLTNYLLARELMNDIQGKTKEKQIEIIKNKLQTFYYINDAIILCLFDLYSNDYQYVLDILKDTNLINDFTNETVLNISFNEKNIKEFLNLFHPSYKEELLLYYGGYSNKPFNCINYLNDYYLNSKNKQLNELSTILSDRYIKGRLKERLKNILYFITLNNYDNYNLDEIFYFSFWCCAAPNQDVRLLATKLLYEVINLDNKYIKLSIDLFNQIEDCYIKDSVIHVLSKFYKTDNTGNIDSFFKYLINNENFTYAKSIKRISNVISENSNYIKWTKINLCNSSNSKISNNLNNLLFSIDLFDKELLPFRYFSKKHIEFRKNFLKINKGQIGCFNKLLEDNFDCVKQEESFCNGSIIFEKNISSLLNERFTDKVIEPKTLLCSLENVIKYVFKQYKLPYQNENWFRDDNFHHSLIRKCVDISIDIFFGSLMCNYYTNEFSTYNNKNNTIGYEIFDPIEFGEDFIIESPIPTYSEEIEILNDKLLSLIQLPEIKDRNWLTDLNITKRNLLALQNELDYKKSKWIVLSVQLSISEIENNQVKWKDTYDYYCCTSNVPSIRGCNDRKLTIELDDFEGNIKHYYQNKNNTHLCKKVKNIKYSSDLFDDTTLVLPPSLIISELNLKPILKNMSWINDKNEIIIYCNNIKKSYYYDFTCGTVFIRKDALEKFLVKYPIKFFAFTERYLSNYGYANETSMHFEIENEIIKNQIPNSSQLNVFLKNNKCEKCSFYTKNSKHTLDYEDIIKYLNY